ncbi:Hypothetical protein NTJ_01037 [Nesidiocoris tenuis]|uniref:Uncharacterized protein n=1 Tax=Nesidiocoris tenuis TaxID=355587 RepID=A0ABN7ABM0_9HEMI|nr:Hypothetical protein NTJ_01037 [Nesidiocoris tenuis]
MSHRRGESAERAPSLRTTARVKEGGDLLTKKLPRETEGIILGYGTVVLKKVYNVEKKLSALSDGNIL